MSGPYTLRVSAAAFPVRVFFGHQDPLIDYIFLKPFSGLPVAVMSAAGKSEYAKQKEWQDSCDPETFFQNIMFHHILPILVSAVIFQSVLPGLCLQICARACFLSIFDQMHAAGDDFRHVPVLIG